LAEDSIKNRSSQKKERGVLTRQSGHQRLMRITSWEDLAALAKYEAAELAARCFVSLRQLERHFMEHRGKTPRKWLRELQCRRARELIEKGYSTKAAATELHFSSAAEFCHQFRKVYGKSPQFFAPLPGNSTPECRSRSIMSPPLNKKPLS